MSLRNALVGACAALLCVASTAAAHDPQQVIANAAEAKRAGLVPQSVGLQLGSPRRAEPELKATPAVTSCSPGSRPETEIQGRMSRAAAAGAGRDGYWCNLERVAHFGRAGGFKVRRYVDKAGRECAYFDTALLAPLNALNLSTTSLGVAVLDMSDPANPKQTANLVTPAMLSPHESLVVSQQRGLLAAVLGNPATNLGLVDVYDLSADCRYPVLKSSSPAGVLGHESGFTVDGLTFYSASPASKSTVAIDLENPSLQVPLWIGDIASHGLTPSADGNRIYVAAVNIGSNKASGLEIYDTSEIQARKPNPVVRQVGSLTWDTVSIPQNATPVTIKGKPYVIEMDEYASFDAARNVGAGRIIDISDETQPRVVSNLRLAVHQPENKAAISGDPGALSPVQGYAGHYCDVPRAVDPDIVACSMIVSGLRVFDIRDPEHPKEVAYHYAPPTAKPENGLMASNFAMSAPAFNSARREVWYSDGVTGFYNLRLTPEAWPTAEGAPPVVPAPTSTTPRVCGSRRVITVTTKKVRGLRLARVVATARGKRVGRSTRSRRVRLVFTGFAKGKVVVSLRLTGRRAGRTVSVTQKRTFNLCASRKSTG